MRGGPLHRAGVLIAVAAAATLLGACGDEAGDGEPDRGPAVAFFMGGIASIELTECVAQRERRGGTEVVTVRDHSRHYPESVVRYADGHEADARTLAERLSISAVTPMDAVTPTLFDGADVAVIVGADLRCP